MATGDRGASVNRAQPRKAKRVAQPKVNLAGISGSGSARTGASSSVPVRKPVIARPVSGVQGGGRAGAGVTATAKVPTKKPLARRIVEQAAGTAADIASPVKLPGAGRKAALVAGGAAEHLPDVPKAYLAAAKRDGTPTRRGPFGVPIVATGTPSKVVAEQKAARQIVKNAPKDAADVLTGAPVSLVEVAKAAATNPRDAGGMMVKPYTDLASDPKTTITEHPVTTGLAVALPGKIGSAGAGRALRATGKQTLKAKPKVLPGTAHRVTESKPRGAFGNLYATRKEAKRTAAQGGGRELKLTDTELYRSVDEFAAAARKRAQRDAAKAEKAAQVKFADKPKAERMAAVEEHVSGARKSIRATTTRDLVSDFGVNVKATVSTPIEGAKRSRRLTVESGPFFSTKQAAKVAATRAGYKDAHIVETSAGKWSAVPKKVWDRNHAHEVVGSSRSVGGITLRAARSALTKTKLPFSGSFHAGTGIEGTIRAIVAGAGPTSYVRGRRVLKQMDKKDREALMDHAVPSGAAEFARKMADESLSSQVAQAPHLKDTAFAEGVAKYEKAKEVTGVKAAGRAYGKAADDAFRAGAGMFENPIQTAMLGRHLKQTHLDNKLIGLSKKSIEQAAKAMSDPAARAQAGRSVRGDYGNYNVFTPGAREGLMHWSPFMPWMVNAAKFPVHTAKKHPVAALTTNNAVAGTYDKRKRMDRTAGDTPGWLLTSIPTKSGAVNLGKFTPAGFWAGALDDPASTVGRQFVPQFGALIDASRGVDYRGKVVRKPGGQKAAIAAYETLMGLTPLDVADRLSGVGDKYVRQNAKGADALTLKRAGDKALRQVFPFMPMPNTSAAAKQKAKRKKKGGPLTRADYDKILEGIDSGGPSREDYDAILNGGK